MKQSRTAMGGMNKRENTIRAARFERPEYIPISFNINRGCWEKYPQDTLQGLMSEHPLLFPGFHKEGKIVPYFLPWRRAGQPYTDSWGCVWETSENGITGAVTKHPLEDWSMFSRFTPPSPDAQNGWGPINWSKIREEISEAKRCGRLAAGALRHGYTFLTLTYLRGYENLIFDMADEEPKLDELIRIVEDFNTGLVQRYIKAGVEWMAFPEDLGMQQGPLLSPDHFRRYIKPSYRRLISRARSAGCVIHMHSDGDIRELANDLMEIGIDVLNLQDVANGVNWIAERLKGRVCIDLDIDRQSITRFGTSDQIDSHIRDAVMKLSNKNGGLMLKYELLPGVPLENIKAIMDAMERYALN
jgi:uroporphyrinogen decarboxylase